MRDSSSTPQPRHTTRSRAPHGADWLTLANAQELLGVGDRRFNRMLRDGQLTAYRSPLDRRMKLIPRAEVEQLLASVGVAMPLAQPLDAREVARDSEPAQQRS